MVSFDMIHCKAQLKVKMKAQLEGKAQLEVLPLPLREGARGRGPCQYRAHHHIHPSSC
jgi:hypothetical protein